MNSFDRSPEGAQFTLRMRLIGCVIACAVVQGCGSPTNQPVALPPQEPFGARLVVGQHELFYTADVEADDARKACEVLVREGWFQEHKASAQVRYVSRRYEVRLVVRAGVEIDPPVKRLRVIGEAVSRDCFRDAPVDVHLCDEVFTTLQVIPFEPIRPELPVRVTVRPSAGGKSLVAQYRNDSTKYLMVKVNLRNATVQQGKEVTVAIGPKGMTEHGWAEGWAYQTGETIRITHADFEPLELVVP